MNSISRIQRLPIYTAILATVLVTPSFMDPINLPKLWILCAGAGLSCAIYLTQFLNLWNSRRRSPLVFAGIFILSLTLSSIASEQGFYRILLGTWGRNNGTLTYLCLLVIFLTLASSNSKEPSIFLLYALTALGFLGAAYGWMQNSGIDPILWENPGNKIILTLGNSDFASAFLALTAIATLTYVLKSETKIWMRVILVVSYSIQMYLTMKSDAIQGVLVLLFGSGILIGLRLTFSNQSKIKKIAVGWWALLATTSLAGLFGLAGNGPLSTLLNPNLRSLQDRYYFWVAALNMLKDNLIFGVGIDSFGDHYRLYRVLEGITLRGTAITGTNNAHNSVMQIAATGGVVLLFAYLALIVFTSFRAVVALRKNNDKILVSGIFAIWIAFLLQSLVSIDQIGLVVWGWAAAGCLVSLSYINSNKAESKIDVKKKKIKLNSKPKLRHNAVLVLLGLVPAILLIPTIQNELDLRNQLVKMARSDGDDTLKKIGQEVVRIASNSKQPELRLQASSYLLTVGLSQDGLTLLKMNVREFPNSFESWNATALFFEGIGQKNEAIYYRTKSVELDPLNAEIKKLLASDRASN